MSIMTLFTINMSHYSEKIRWILDFEKLPYKEIPLTPALHTLPMLIRGKRLETTVPTLEDGNINIQDSPRIVQWLAKHHSPLHSYPVELAEDIQFIEKRFDRIGKPIARYLYLPGFAHKELILDIWTQFAKPWESIFIRAMYPIIKPIFQIKLKINKTDVSRAEKLIDAEINWLNDRLSRTTSTHGVKYLVGERLTVADITVAALLAPLACPAEHPIYGHPLFYKHMATPAGRWANTPAMEWVRKLYSAHRGVIWEKQPHLQNKPLQLSTLQN